jgi:hypothetical protein
MVLERTWSVSVEPTTATTPQPQPDFVKMAGDRLDKTASELRFRLARGDSNEEAGWSYKIRRKVEVSGGAERGPKDRDWLTASGPVGSMVSLAETRISNSWSTALWDTRTERSEEIVSVVFVRTEEGWSVQSAHGRY